MEVSIVMGVPQELDGLFHGKSHLEMDENWGYPCFKKTPNDETWAFPCAYGGGSRSITINFSGIKFKLSTNNLKVH